MIPIWFLKKQSELKHKLLGLVIMENFKNGIVQQRRCTCAFYIFKLNQDFESEFSSPAVAK